MRWSVGRFGRSQSLVLTLSVSPSKRPCVTLAMIAARVSSQAVVELDDSGDLQAARPGEPRVEHHNGSLTASVEHEG